MQPDFWLDRWRTAQIGFHQAAADRHLKAYWPRLMLPSKSVDDFVAIVVARLSGIIGELDISMRSTGGAGLEARRGGDGDANGRAGCRNGAGP